MVQVIQAFPRRRPASARFSVFLLSPLWLGITRIWCLKKEVKLSCLVALVCIECGLGSGGASRELRVLENVHLEKGRKRSKWRGANYLFQRFTCGR